MSERASRTQSAYLQEMAMRLQRCQEERRPQFAERPSCIDNLSLFHGNVSLIPLPLSGCRLLLGSTEVEAET